MRIGMVLDGSYPKDIRVRKEAETLAKEHQVYVFCVKSESEPEFEEVNGVYVVRNVKYKSFSHQGVIDIMAAINFIHPFFKKRLPSFVKEFNIEVLHVHDLPLAKTVIKVAEKLDIKTVLDLHENYPSALKTWFLWRKNPIIKLKNKLFFSYNRWRKYESRIIKRFDVLIAVVEEMKERIVKQHAIDAKKIVVVTNAEKKDFADNFLREIPNYFKQEDGFYISYVGGFGPHRGLQTAIEGMKFVKAKIPHAKLILVGPANKDVLLHLNGVIEKNKVQDCVVIKKAEPFENVVNIMKSSDINMIPHISNEHTESTIPHKFYQILLSGKPLLVSTCAPMKRIVEDKNIGTCFQAQNASSFAKEVIAIYENYELALEKAKRGYQESYDGDLNWEFLSKNLITLYDNL